MSRMRGADDGKLTATQLFRPEIAIVFADLDAETTKTIAVPIHPPAVKHHIGRLAKDHLARAVQVVVMDYVCCCHEAILGFPQTLSQCRTKRVI
jgi:hypothetical protein